MPITTEQYADAAVRLKPTFAPHVGWPLAVIKTIEGKGVTHKPDIERIKPLVLNELRRRGVIKTARQRLYQKGVR